MSVWRVNGYIWLEILSDASNQLFMNADQQQLLRTIQQTGSINKAAQLLHMSYKRAWIMVHGLNTMAGIPLVSMQTGGNKGGGTVITPAGDQYLTLYQTLHDQFQQFVTGELTETANRLMVAMQAQAK